MNEVAELELPTQENFRTDLRTLFQGAIREALEAVLEDEIREMVGAKKWERQAQRVDSRNGTYLRRLITSMGAIDLQVPRAREAGSAGAAVVGRYRRRSAEIDDAMVSAYVHGASTRFRVAPSSTSGCLHANRLRASGDASTRVHRA